ncbi:MAG: DUF1493 family protein [Terracidiphilus sp.]
MGSLPFEQFADFIRESCQISQKRRIAPETQFERDLGVTGDDGVELLEATEKRFNIRLATEEDGLRKTFNLGPNEYLFNSEGFGLFPFRSFSIFGRNPTPTVRAFTVGELHDAVLKAINK